MFQQRCDSLVRICESAAWSVDPETVYQSIVDTSVSLFECEGAHLHLMAVDNERFVRHASHSEKQALKDRKNEFGMGVGRVRWMIKSRQPILMNYKQPHIQDEIPASAIEMGYESAVSIPLVTENEVFGLLSLVYKCALPWTERDIPYLLDIGRILGVLIQRMQKTKKDTELQLLNERKRLSTEIHDNISQLISSLAIGAEAALVSFEEGDVTALGVDLERLSEISRKTMKVLREEMLSLRLPLDRTDSLPQAIRDSLARFEKNWGIATSLVVIPQEAIVVPLQAAFQLVRILNECLSNTLKHAEASCVSVMLEEDERHLVLTVQDDGCGFDTNSIPLEHLGIRIMKERAAATGGKLTVMSTNAGTTICVDVPRLAL